MTDPAAPPRAYPPALKLTPWVWYFIYAWAKFLVWLRFRVRVTVPDGMPRGPVLLAVKHVSAWDIPVATVLVRRILHLRKPYFQMGSFIGYPVFGRIVPVLQACGGFSVLRPKEVLRLRKLAERDRPRIRALMDEVNGVAESTRQAVLAQGGVLVVFPEGTRDPHVVRQVRSAHEIESALAVAARADGDARPIVVPATFNYGARAGLRRRLDIDVAEPIGLEGLDAAAIAAKIEAIFRGRWRPA
jgi:1-acyl-sn-glycerol-3-phosphate acyltransferase